jgi:hypothetical protein
MTKFMEKILIIGLVGLGGYILLSHVASQASGANASSPGASGSTTTTGNPYNGVSNTLAGFFSDFGGTTNSSNSPGTGDTTGDLSGTDLANYADNLSGADVVNSSGVTSGDLFSSL